MFGNLGFTELLLIGTVILLLFGAKRIPEFMGGLGKGIKEFKKNMNDINSPEVSSPVERDRLRAPDATTVTPAAEESRPEPKRLI